MKEEKDAGLRQPDLAKEPGLAVPIVNREGSAIPTINKDTKPGSDSQQESDAEKQEGG